MSQFTSNWYLQKLASQQKSQQADCNEGVAMESDLHDAIIQECKARGWLYFHSRMDKRTGRTEGEPDFCILTHGGRVLFVEAKAKKGKLSDAQLRVKAFAHLLGHKIHTVYNIQQFRAITAGAKASAVVVQQEGEE